MAANQVMKTSDGMPAALPEGISSSLTEPERAEARAMANQLAQGDLQAIYGFGRDVGATVSNQTDDLLSQIKASDLDAIGEKLGQVISAAQTLNLHALSDIRSRIPLIGPYLDRLRLKKNDFVRQFQGVRTQVDTLMSELDEMQRGLSQRNVALEDAYAAVTQEYRQLCLHIAAGEIAIANFREPGAPGHPQQGQATTVSALDKRIGDLRMLQHAALQQLPMIRMVQTNNLMLIEKFHTIKQLTVPAWKRQFMLSVSLHEQRNAVELSNTIDDATNEFLRENARLLKENTIATAQANQRMVIDIETLQEVHDGLMSTVEEVIRINREGAQKRAGVSAQLAAMRSSLGARPETADADR